MNSSEQTRTAMMTLESIAAGSRINGVGTLIAVYRNEATAERKFVSFRFTSEIKYPQMFDLIPEQIEATSYCINIMN